MIQGNYIGTDITGNNAVPTGDMTNPFQNQGVIIIGSNNMIGGSAAGAGNVISANKAAEVFFNVQGDGSGGVIQSSNNTVAGNLIGIFVNGGDSRRPERSRSAFTFRMRQSILIGGTQPGARNVISGNTVGVYLFDGTLADSLGGNSVKANYIGTDAGGGFAVPNSVSGIVINQSSGNTIGGAQSGERNVISGNGGAGGVVMEGTASPPVGPNRSPLHLPDGLDLPIQEPIGNKAGSKDASTMLREIVGTARPFETSTRKNQLPAKPSSPSTGVTQNNVVIGNYIGTSADGQSAIPNSPFGVGVILGSSNNIIGQPGAGNVISGNTDTGVFLGNLTSGDPTPVSNTVQANQIGLDPMGTFSHSEYQIRNTDSRFQ